MVRIKRQIVPGWVLRGYSYGGTNSKKYIIIHETANTGVGAGAQAHANLQTNGNSRMASWQWQVDDIQAIQSFPDDAQAYHAGSRYYNQNGIGIEMAVNRDGDFDRTVKNTVALVQMLMKRYGIPTSRVIRHKDASGKHCPANLISGGKGVTWAQFKSMISGKVVPSNTASKSENTVAHEVLAGKWGNNPQRAQNLRNAGYNPSAVQSEVNRILRGKSPSKPSKPTKTKSTSEVAQEVLDGEWGNNPRRAQDLKRAGYNPSTIQAEVNRIAGGSNKPKPAPKPTPKPKLKSINEIAVEVNAGKWGNGNDRINRLKRAGYNPSTVQAEVNRLAGGGGSSRKSASAVANDIIAGRGDWGTGSTRQNRLRKAGYNPTEVQNLINKRL